MRIIENDFIGYMINGTYYLNIKHTKKEGVRGYLLKHRYF